eukprot:s702_g42.t1
MALEEMPKGQPKGKGKGASDSNTECFNSVKKGHLAKDCKNPSKRKHCGKDLAKDCWEKDPSKRPKTAAVPQAKAKPTPKSKGRGRGHGRYGKFREVGDGEEEADEA